MIDKRLSNARDPELRNTFLVEDDGHLKNKMRMSYSEKKGLGLFNWQIVCQKFEWTKFRSFDTTPKNYNLNWCATLSQFHCDTNQLKASDTFTDFSILKIPLVIKIFLFWVILIGIIARKFKLNMEWLLLTHSF